MTVAWHELLLVAAAAGSGLIAGLCFTFGSFVMRALDSLGAATAIRTMQAINTTILRSSAMAVWFGSAVLGALATALAEERALAGSATALYVLGALVITGRGNVPLNESLDRIDPEAAGVEETWHHYRVRWGRWNDLRTALCLLASIGFTVAVRWS